MTDTDGPASFASAAAGPAASADTPWIRADGPAKVTGQARYTADLAFPGLAHARLLLAGRAHARIVRLDTARARALPGVLAVLTQDDVPERRYGSFDFVLDRTLFARDVVRFEGEVVAAVAALTPEQASAAVAAIDVEYEDLPPILDVEAALAPDSPLVHEAIADYRHDPNLDPAGNVAGRSTIVKGDAGAALAGAPVVVRERYVADMAHPVPIEPHAVTADWSGDRVTIYSSTQVPFYARGKTAEVLELPEHRIRVVVTHLGGGFGGKCDFHFEAHVAALARAARRPVRLVLSRREEFIAPDKVTHAMIVDLETGLTEDGTILARKARILLDSGAYASDTPVLGQIAAMMIAGPYRIPDVDIEAISVYTNRTPAGSVRAPTGPQACWAVEQHHDVVAARVGLDPVEFRWRNLVRDGDEGPTRQLHEGNGAIDTLVRAVEGIQAGDPLGPNESVGVASGWWFSAPGPSGAFVRLESDGSGRIVTGAQENGTGAVMALAILAAEELGLKPDDFAITYQDTDTGPYDGGSSGSQTTFNNGRAVVEAAREVRRQLLELASVALEAAVGDLELADGHAGVVGSPDRRISIAELAATAHDGALLLARGSGMPPDAPAHDASACVGRLGFESFASPTFFCHAARVRVDPATGIVRTIKVVAATDVGRVLNRTGAIGQVTGGVVMALGNATLEGTIYGGDGRQRNASLLDYKLLTSADSPEIEAIFVEHPASNGGPRGSKGVGEPPIVPTAGAVANAIAAATGRRIRRLPMTPERVWRAVTTGDDGAAEITTSLGPRPAAAEAR
ncbi:MAG TPA: xanthine dehydrogenase family protein molybdopterin-binding subunit [Candidatus Limnocylindrales bacterium]|nr:xanthine dehydrogenase family protein molybdopterin-binding subunit [Candidatus Limnocylindrales bacterium]